MSFDNVCKLIAEKHPLEFATWLLSEEPSQVKVLKNEYVSETTTHRYRVIRMWEQDPDLFLNNPALLPLAPLTRTDSPDNLLAQVSESIAKIADGEIRQNIAGYAESPQR